MTGLNLQFGQFILWLKKVGKHAKGTDYRLSVSQSAMHVLIIIVITFMDCETAAWPFLCP